MDTDSEELEEASELEDSELDETGARLGSRESMTSA
jgi:hypothetical protein